VKLALVHPRLDQRGGAENVVLWMARGMQQRGHEVVVATDRFSPRRWGERDWDGIPMVASGERRFDRWKHRAARKRAPGRRLRRALDRCEWIIAHNSPAHIWATEAAATIPGARVVWYCEEPPARIHWRESMPTLAAALADPDGYPWLDRDRLWLRDEQPARARKRRRIAVDREIESQAVARVDRILANSAFTGKNAERVYGVPVVACELGLPEPARVAPRAGAPYVAWITSASAHKNAYGFLEAIRIAVRDLGARDLRVCGIGLRNEKLERRVAELGIEEIVERREWLPDDELNRVIAGCRLLAYPSIDEPFGLVPLHAMSHGRPVLASCIGGPAETVVHEVTGLHCDPMSPRDMATRLCELWESPDRCDVLGAAGRQRYRAHYRFEQFLDRFERAAFGRTSPGAGG
jgi:glycosyltransferase involved in cell wall biosynthesis